MSIGRKRNYFALQEVQPIANEINEDVPDPLWQTVDNLWVAIVPLSGREFAIAQQVNSLIRNKFVIRNMIGITDRILNDFRFYDPINKVAFNIVFHLTEFYTQDTEIELLCILDENP